VAEPVPASGADPRLVLASASPRRLELLRRVGLDPLVDPADVDEAVQPGEPALDYVQRVAFDKAVAVADRRSGDGSGAELILAADTSVVLDGEPLGKPLDETHARSTLAHLSGRTHEVMTAVSLVGADTVTSICERARVTFAELSAAEIDWYVRSGEPLDKAGSYALQGLGAALVERIDGDPTTVIGLPLHATLRLLRGAGLRWPDAERR
jgi:septum formation protein